MNVGLNTALYNSQGVDLINVEKVANNIINSTSNQQISVKAIDYSKFNRASLGIDLYSSRTNSELQKQIALTQAGLYAQAINVSELNSKAAANLYAASTVQKNVSLTQSTTGTDLEPVKTVEKLSNSTETYSTADSNSKSSSETYNPFANSGKEAATQDE